MYPTKCPQCAYPNVKDRALCGRCGVKFAAVSDVARVIEPPSVKAQPSQCPQCDYPNPQNRPLCGRCGLMFNSEHVTQVAEKQALNAAIPTLSLNQGEALTPLSCHQCGGVVPLPDGPVAVCPFCQAQTALPAKYVEWNNEKRAKRQADLELATLHDALGKAPSANARALLKLDGRATGCLSIVLALGLGGPLLSLALKVINPVIELVQEHTNLITPDTFGATTLTALLIGPFALPPLLFIFALLYTRRRVVAVRALQRNFVAARPVHEGGPACCRTCNATLHVPAGQAHAVCGYCTAHNLIPLDHDWLGELRAQSVQTKRTLQEALDAYASETHDAKWRIGKYVAVIGVIGFFFYLMLASSMARDASFEEMVAEHTIQPAHGRFPLPLDEPIAFKWEPNRGISEKGYFTGKLQVAAKIAMQKGETFRLVRMGGGTNELTVELNRRTQTAVTKNLARGEDVSFTAKKSQWLNIAIKAIAEPPVPFTVQMQLHRDGRSVVGTPAASPKSKLDLVGARVAGLALGDVVEDTRYFLPLEPGPEGWRMGQVQDTIVVVDENARILELWGKGLTLADGSGRTAAKLAQAHRRAMTLVRSDARLPTHVYEDGDIILMTQTEGAQQDVQALIRKVDARPFPAHPRYKRYQGVNRFEANQAAIGAKFRFDKKSTLRISGIRPGMSKSDVEAILDHGKSRGDGMRQYGDVTVLYAKEKVQWVNGPQFTQQNREGESIAVRVKDIPLETFAALGERALEVRINPLPKKKGKRTSRKRVFHGMTHYIRLKGMGWLGVHINGDEATSVSLMGKGALPSLRIAKIEKMKLGAQKKTLKLSKFVAHQTEDATNKEVILANGPVLRFGDDGRLDYIEGNRLKAGRFSIVHDEDNLKAFAQSYTPAYAVWRLDHPVRSASASRASSTVEMEFETAMGTTLSARWSKVRLKEIALWKSSAGKLGPTTPVQKK